MEWNIRQFEERRGGSRQEIKSTYVLGMSPKHGEIQGEKGRGVCTCSHKHTPLFFKKEIMTTVRCVCTCTQKCEKLKQDSKGSCCWGEIFTHIQRKPYFSGHSFGTTVFFISFMHHLSNQKLDF